MSTFLDLTDLHQVTTPEKWDVVTRKSGNDDNALGNQCGLLIFDEIHLLADEGRGAGKENMSICVVLEFLAFLKFKSRL